MRVCLGLLLYALPLALLGNLKLCLGQFLALPLALM